MTAALIALILQAEVAAGIPEGLLVAVVTAETRGRNVVAYGRGKGKRGCDVGVAQIHVRDCNPERVRKLLDVRTNLTAATQILLWSRNFCEKRLSDKRCRGSLWGRYNPGSPTWWPKVRAHWEGYHAAKGPTS